jgi:hypothetical protein
MLNKIIDWLDNFFDQLTCEHDWELTYQVINNITNKKEYHYVCLDCGKKMILNHRL